jgi:hypothetical protein
LQIGESFDKGPLSESSQGLILVRAQGGALEPPHAFEQQFSGQVRGNTQDKVGVGVGSHITGVSLLAEFDNNYLDEHPNCREKDGKSQAANRATRNRLTRREHFSIINPGCCFETLKAFIARKSICRAEIRSLAHNLAGEKDLQGLSGTVVW